MPLLPRWYPEPSSLSWCPAATGVRLPNGGRIQDEELHQWHFGPDGKIVSFRHYCDTAKHIAAAAAVEPRHR